MRKHLLLVCVAFQAISLLLYAFRESPMAVAVFALSCLAFGWVCYLERRDEEEIKALREVVNALANRVSETQMRLGWGP